MPKIAFKPEVSMGNILSMIGIAGSVLIGAAASIDARASQTAKINYIEKTQSEMRETMKQLAENENLLTRSVDRLTVIVERGNK